MTAPGAVRSLLRACVAALAVAIAAPAAAGWWEVYRADAAFDLTEARRQALETVADAPQSADAVAAAAWWLANLTHLSAPAEIVDAAGQPRDPELAFLLAVIDGQLARRPPVGALANPDIAGPFGRFPTLDLERGVVPQDGDLPPEGTPWSDPWTPFRLRVQSASGAAAPPQAMTTGGVYLAAWTVRLDDELGGWLVVDGEGSFDLTVDGRRVARLRRCGRVDAGVSWFRVGMAPGRHRLRVEMASPERPWVRVSLLDDHGAAAGVVEEGTTGPWAASTVARAEPPATAALTDRLSRTGGTVSDLMLAAALATTRADPVAARADLERARELAPGDPWPRLGLARFFLEEPTGSDPASDARQAREELRQCQEVPLALLMEQRLAVQEDRPEDAERLLTQLVDEHGDDPRVLELWVGEAVKRGWVREIEEGMARLEAVLPASSSVIELRLQALAALERWHERRQLLETLLRSDGLEPAALEVAVAGCQLDEALAALKRLQGRFDDPGLDMSLARLEMARGDSEAAAREVERSWEHWGALPGLEQLRLLLAAGKPGGLEAPLAAALERDPGDLALRSLAWREGREPFFAPYHVPLQEVLTGEDRAAGDGVDAVLLLDQAVERVFSDGASMYYYHGVTRALTPVGARQAAVLQPLPNTIWLNVQVHKADGSVESPSDLTPHDGEVTLDDVKAGDVVEEEYVAAVGPTAVARRAHLSPYTYRFADPERAFGRSEYVLLYPKEVELQLEGNFTGLATKRWEQDGLEGMRWRAETVPPIQAEPFAPPTQELLPWVSYGFGVSWADVGDGLRDRVLEMLSSGADLDRWGASATVGDGPLDQVHALVNALCDRVEPGRSVLELDSAAGSSFGRRQGNRLLILAAVLLREGWDVDLVLARPRPLAGTHLGVPSLDTFSEPLLRARRAGVEVWLDMEEQRRGVDHIRPLLQGGDGLVLPLSDPQRPVTILDRLPSFPNPELEQRVAVTAALDAAGNASLAVEMALAGGEAERLEQQIGSVSKERVGMAFDRMAGSLFPGAEQVHGKLEKVAGGAVLSFDLRLPGACERDGEEMVCRSLVLGRPLVPVLASLPSRSYPLILQLPVQRRFTVTIRPPAGWTVERPARQLQADWGSLEETLEEAPDGIRSELVLAIPAQTVDPEDYPRFARFCHAVDELMSRPPRLAPPAH